MYRQAIPYHNNARERRNTRRRQANKARTNLYKGQRKVDSLRVRPA